MCYDFIKVVVRVIFQFRRSARELLWFLLAFVEASILCILGLIYPADCLLIVIYRLWIIWLVNFYDLVGNCSLGRIAGIVVEMAISFYIWKDGLGGDITKKTPDILDSTTVLG